jgi:pimeloyl-ACP methyl ester carboxylesterase
VDARGHGASDKPQDPHVHAWQFYVADLIAVLDHLHIPTAHFFGYSMGGSIGFAMAQFAPQRFASLIIGGAAPYQRSPAQVEARLQALKAGPEGIVAIWDTPISPALQARLLANDVEAIAASWMGRMQSPGLQDVLPTMTMPCLVFVGKADSIYPAVQACVLQMPKVIFVSFPGLKLAETHFHSDLVLPYVTNFLATVTRQATAQ